jgi:regulator of nucleoside diphosphate kinase
MSSKHSGKPAISVCQSDFDLLSALADAFYAHNPSVAEELLAELDRARVIDDDAFPSTVARIGSTLRYSADTGDKRLATLVLPKYADISKGYVSILTPIGVALLGLSPGQSIEWISPHGDRHTLTVENVGQIDSNQPGFTSAS